MKRFLLILTLIPGLLLLSSCKKESKEDVTYYLAFYQVGDYVKSDHAADIKTLIQNAVDDWKKEYRFNWSAEDGKSLKEQDAAALQYMEDAFASFSKVATKLKADILEVDPNPTLTLSWTFEAMRKDTKPVRLGTARKVEILNGDQSLD